MHNLNNDLYLRKYILYNCANILNVVYFLRGDEMGTAQTKATNRWISKSYDKINLTVPKGQKASIQAHAEHMGESMNAFIRRAIDETMIRDGEQGKDC